MNYSINQQRERIAELEKELDKAYNDLANFEGYPEEVSALRHDIERRKRRCINLLNERKEWKDRAESAEQRVKELEEVNDIMLTRLMAAALALASGRKCPDASEALNKFAIEIMSLTLNAAVDVDVIDILDTENHAKVSARFNELRAKGGDE